MGVYTDYFQKSKVFLYPLLELRKGLTHVPKQTYSAWEDVYSVEDRMFLCLYKTPLNESFQKFITENIHSNKYYDQHIELAEGKHLFVFDFSSLKFDYDNFIKGSYSKYSVDSKVKILDFFGNDDKVSEYIHSFLSPEDSGYGSVRENESVIGVVIDGNARAYPLSILREHEIVDENFSTTYVAVGY